MKIVFTVDLHGDRTKYSRLVEVAKDFKAEVIINGGDMLPKGKDILNQGEFITDFLDGYFSELNTAGIYHLSYLGNDDLQMFDKLFEDTCGEYPYIINLAQRKFEHRGYEFIGMNWVGDYPFLLKDRCRKDTEDFVFPPQLGKGLVSTALGIREIRDWVSYATALPTIEDELCRLVRPVAMEKAVYVFHMPPTGLGLDICFDGREVGSKAIFRFIEKNQPLLTLHGHIHESPDRTGIWQAKLGKTICVQPGQPNRLLTYVTIDLDAMKIDRWQI